MSAPTGHGHQRSLLCLLRVTTWCRSRPDRADRRSAGRGGRGWGEHRRQGRQHRPLRARHQQPRGHGRRARRGGPQHAENLARLRDSLCTSWRPSAPTPSATSSWRRRRPRACADHVHRGPHPHRHLHRGPRRRRRSGGGGRRHGGDRCPVGRRRVRRSGSHLGGRAPWCSTATSPWPRSAAHSTWGPRPRCAWCWIRSASPRPAGSPVSSAGAPGVPRHAQRRRAGGVDGRAVDTDDRQRDAVQALHDAGVERVWSGSAGAGRCSAGPRRPCSPAADVLDVTGRATHAGVLPRCWAGRRRPTRPRTDAAAALTVASQHGPARPHRPSCRSL